MKRDILVNFSDEGPRRSLLMELSKLRGPHRISVCKYRKRRTDRQLRYYWPCVVQPFADFLRAQGENVTDDEAHEYLKLRFNGREIINPGSGEVVGTVGRSTGELDTSEFNDYVERCAAWLAEFGVIVQAPNGISSITRNQTWKEQVS